MSRKLVRTAFLILLALGAAFAAAAQNRGDKVGYHDTLVVAAGETRDNVVSFGGDIVVDGKVRRTVFALGGTITVAGEVGEAVVGIGAAIRLKPTAVIRGDLVGIGGSIAKEEGFQVEGDTVYFRAGELTGKVFGQGLRGLLALSFWPLIIVFKLVNGFLWMLTAIVVAALFPRQVVYAAGRVRREFGAMFGTGILALIIFTFFVAVSAVLCLVLIGIPILLSLVLAGLVVKVFGKVVLFYVVGESLAASFNKKSVTPLGGALLGLFALILIGFVPILGFLVSLAVSILGWGAVLRTKFGTSERWFPHPAKPAPPASPAA